MILPSLVCSSVSSGLKLLYTLFVNRTYRMSIHTFHFVPFRTSVMCRLWRMFVFLEKPLFSLYQRLIETTLIGRLGFCLFDDRRIESEEIEVLVFSLLRAVLPAGYCSRKGSSVLFDRHNRMASYPPILYAPYQNSYLQASVRHL
jgi:hypothetical protein